jgi:tetratricopeptide (TPR) repeat protein
MQSGSLAVSVELVDGEDSSRVWGKTYTNNISDTMRLPDEISRDVAKQLNIQAGGDSESQRSKRYTDNQIAYDYYLRGRFHWNRRPSGLAQGITFFQQAIQADPGYALAYSGLADSYSIMASFGYDALPPGQAMPQARAAAMKSVELDPSLAEARVSLAYVDMMEYKWKAAEMGYQKAIQISPGYALAHHWYAHVLWATGRTRESLLELTKAKELDPLSPVIRTALGRQFYFTRQYDLAIEEYRTALDLDPAYIQARLALALLYQEKGLPEQANKELQITDDLLNGQKTHSLHWAPGGDFPVLIGLFGRSYALLGKRNEALTQLTRLQQLSTTRYVPPFYFAAIYIALGDNNQAFTWLQKSYADKYEALIYLQVEPGFDGLRSDPRFSQLLQQMDLQP